MLIGSTNCTEPGFHAVRNTCQRAIVKQMRNITPITNIDLLPRVVNCGICISRVLEFYYAKRQPVDKQKHIRSAGFFLTVVDIFYSKLIHAAENVIVRGFKVDQWYYSRDAVLWSELYTADHPTIDLVKRRKVTFRTDKTDRIHNLMNFIREQIWIGPWQKVF